MSPVERGVSRGNARREPDLVPPVVEVVLSGDVRASACMILASESPKAAGARVPNAWALWVDADELEHDGVSRRLCRPKRSPSPISERDWSQSACETT